MPRGEHIKRDADWADHLEPLSSPAFARASGDNIQIRMVLDRTVGGLLSPLLDLAGRAFRCPLLRRALAPSGLLHLIGFHFFDNGFYVFDGYFKQHPVSSPLLLLSVHALFWWAYIYLLCKRKRMPRTVLFRFSWTLLVVLAANLIGCSTMSFST